MLLLFCVIAGCLICGYFNFQTYWQWFYAILLRSELGRASLWAQTWLNFAMYSQFKQNTKHFCAQTSFKDNLERIEMAHRCLQHSSGPQPGTLHNFLQTFVCRTTWSNGEILVSLFPLSLAEGFPLKALQFCAVFVRFVMWMMSYVPMMTLPTWPLLWIGLGPSISALICCDVIVMLLLNALASILCSLTNCLCEPCTRLKLTKPKHARTSLFIGHTIISAMEG